MRRKRRLIAGKWARYTDYLKSSEWKERRAVILARDQHCCQECGNPDQLQVHHKTYERIGDEYPDDLITLCNWCHEKEHGIVEGKKPVKPKITKTAKGKTSKKKRPSKRKKKKRQPHPPNPLKVKVDKAKLKDDILVILTKERQTVFMIANRLGVNAPIVSRILTNLAKQDLASYDAREGFWSLKV